jgi:spore maturation protein CgeB
MYEHRTNLMEALKHRGYSVFYDTGPAYDDARRIYHSTRIGLNWSSRLDTTARVFELMAFGILPVLNRVPDLVEMFKDGEQFVGFDNESEAIEKINFFIKNPEAANTIATAAMEAVKPHSWDARMETVMQQVRLSLGR